MENWTRARHAEEALERRKHNRFRVQHGGFTSIYPKSTVVPVIGNIMNIGSGGLAFCYVASETRTNGPSQLNIRWTVGTFCLEKVPFIPVWDSALPDEFSFGLVTLRHCGVQFGELTHGQKVVLEHFIRSYTLGGARVSHSTLPHNVPDIVHREVSSCSTSTPRQ